MRLLVTGGCGFIGSNFIRYWLQTHALDEILNVDLLTYAGDQTTLLDIERDYSARYRFVRADIADVDAMSQAMQSARPSVVVNFAAESHNSRGVVDPSAFVRTNVLGTQTLLEVARRARVDRVHHVSTCEVYGDLPLDEGSAFTEESPYRPRTPYSASKAAADLVVRAYHDTYGTPATISNCCNNYGPWQHPEKMIPLFITRALSGRPLPLYRQSANRREWIDVEDHCRGIDAIIRDGRSGESYNVGTGDERSIDEVAELVLQVLELPMTLKTYVDDRPGHDRRYLLDHSKVGAHTGWRPEIAFNTGLRTTIAWYAENERWWRTKTSDNVDEFAWAVRGREGVGAT